MHSTAFGNFIMHELAEIDISESIVHYTEVQGARALIHDRCEWCTSGEPHLGRCERLHPRLALTFLTGYYSGSARDVIQYDVDVLETIKLSPSAFSYPAIAPVIKRWEGHVRLYGKCEIKSDGREFYDKVAYPHLQNILPERLKAVRARALPPEHAMMKVINLSGIDDELFYLDRACFFMTEDEFKAADNGYMGIARLKKRLKALERHLEAWAEARAKGLAQKKERRSQEQASGVIEAAREVCLRSVQNVLKFFEVDVKEVEDYHKKPLKDFNLSYPESVRKKEAKLNKSILIGHAQSLLREEQHRGLYRDARLRGETVEQPTAHEVPPSLQLKRRYLAWRLQMNGKNVARYMNKLSKESKDLMSKQHQILTEASPPDWSDLPDPTFDPIDTRDIADGFSFKAVGVRLLCPSNLTPNLRHLEVFYRDDIGRHQQQPMTLVLFPRKVESKIGLTQKPF
ncbi:MAG: hypothetical protein M3R15_06610 [Acidobacteriota bacterium]|nr:hypothetical protein [Acidobacteriota bacterium]